MRGFCLHGLRHGFTVLGPDGPHPVLCGSLGLCVFLLRVFHSFLPAPLTSLPNAERTPGIKYKSSTNRKQRLETELQPLPKPGNSSALVLGARDFKLHICAVWLTGCTFFSVRLKTGSAYATRVPLGSETHIRLHTGCTVD